MQYNLNNLWEMLENYNIRSSEEEQKFFSDAENKKLALLRLMDDDQKRLFFHYEEAMSSLIETERKEAFIKGVKFATKFLLEATEK